MARGMVLGGSANFRHTASKTAPCQKLVSPPPTSTTFRVASSGGATQCFGHMKGAATFMSGGAGEKAPFRGGRGVKAFSARQWLVWWVRHYARPPDGMRSAGDTTP